jgi:hypothetical protein
VEFRIADTFTDSSARLTGEEQKAIKTTAFDLQLKACANTGLSNAATRNPDIDRLKDLAGKRPMLAGHAPFQSLN